MGKNKFDVEEIVDEKVENGKKYYKLKWKGYPSSSNTWEPAENILSDCPVMVENFEKRLKKNNGSFMTASPKKSSSAAQLAVADSSSSTSKDTEKLQSNVRGPGNSKTGRSKPQQGAATKPRPGVAPRVYGRGRKSQNPTPQDAAMTQDATTKQNVPPINQDTPIKLAAPIKPHPGQLATRKRAIKKACIGLPTGQESRFQKALVKPRPTGRNMKSNNTSTKASVTTSGGRNTSQEAARDPRPIQPGPSEKINTRLPLKTGGKPKVANTESATVAVQNPSPKIEDSATKGKRRAKGKARPRRTVANKRSQAPSAKRQKVEKENDTDPIQIIGAAPDDNDKTKVQFLFKYAHTDDTKFVSREEAIVQYPQLVISFYESRFKWSKNNGDATNGNESAVNP